MRMTWISVECPAVAEPVAPSRSWRAASKAVTQLSNPRVSQAGALVWPDLPWASEAAMSEDASGVRR